MGAHREEGVGLSGDRLVGNGELGSRCRKEYVNLSRGTDCGNIEGRY